MGQARVRVPRIAETAVERARLTVVPRRSVQAPRAPFLVLVAVVLLGGVVGLLLFNTSMQQVSFRATALETRAAALQAERQQLQMEVDNLRDPQRVSTRASDLGMVPMVNPAFINLGDGSVLGDAAPATADSRIRLHALPTKRPAAYEVRTKVETPQEMTAAEQKVYEAALAREAAALEAERREAREQARRERAQERAQEQARRQARVGSRR